MPAIDIAHNNYLTARSTHEGMKAQGEHTEWKVLDNSAIVVGSRVAAGLHAFQVGSSETRFCAESSCGSLTALWC
jgi:hypothetical protein